MNVKLLFSEIKILESSNLDKIKSNHFFKFVKYYKETNFVLRLLFIYQNLVKDKVFTSFDLIE